MRQQKQRRVAEYRCTTSRPAAAGSGEVN